MKNQPTQRLIVIVTHYPKENDRRMLTSTTTRTIALDGIPVADDRHWPLPS
jgi:hypothetical protein